MSEEEKAKETLAILICWLCQIEQVDSADGSPNWWAFKEDAAKVIDDLARRGFTFRTPLPPPPDQGEGK